MTTSLNPSALADEFEVPHGLMAEFMSRFAPALVARGAHAEPSDTMLFVHIPKTAGVSVGKSFQQAFDQFHAVQWDNIAASFRSATRLAAYNQSRRRLRQVIMGHYGWPELQMWRNHDLPMKCGAIFRDPVDRAVSNYNYNCSPAHPARENFMARFPTLEKYVEQLGYDVQMTQAIGIVTSFEVVLRKFCTYYTFLGVTERLGASLGHLSRSHGLPAFAEHRENVGQRQAAPVDDRIRAIVADRSHNDARLHRLLLRLYDA